MCSDAHLGYSLSFQQFLGQQVFEQEVLFLYIINCPLCFHLEAVQSSL